MELSDDLVSVLEQVANLGKIGKTGKLDAHYEYKEKYSKNGEK